MDNNVIDLSPRHRAYGPNSNIGVITQARMTSKRFPGKSLAMFNGKPVLQHVIERAKLIRAPFKIKKPIQVIVAVPDTPESEPMLELIAKCGASNFCGSEDNVLERYYGAASFFNLDIIVRITADCPFLHHEICNEVLGLLLWRKVDYTSNVFPERTYPKGLDCEAFTFECLEATYITAMEELKLCQARMADPKGHILAAGAMLDQAKYNLEHVTPLMQSHKEIKRALVSNMYGNTSKDNYCIDYPEDIQRLEKYSAKMLSKCIVRTKASND